MPDTKDLTTWTEDYLLQQIQNLIPKGHRLQCDPGEHAWEVSVVEDIAGEEEEDAPSLKTHWQDHDTTYRNALFKAYHRYWAPPLQAGDPWSLKANRPTLKAVAHSLSKKYADPEDLDPEEVASVYAKMNPDTKRK